MWTAARSTNPCVKRKLLRDFVQDAAVVSAAARSRAEHMAAIVEDHSVGERAIRT